MVVEGEREESRVGSMIEGGRRRQGSEVKGGKEEGKKKVGLISTRFLGSLQLELGIFFDRKDGTNLRMPFLGFFSRKGGGKRKGGRGLRRRKRELKKNFTTLQPTLCTAVP